MAEFLGWFVDHTNYIAADRTNDRGNVLDLDLMTVIERIDALANQRMGEAGTPGLVIALTDRQWLQHAAAYGYANAASHETMTTGHLLETESIGGTFYRFFRR